jgi:elongation factor Ts
MQWLKDKGMITADKKAEQSTREGVIAARTLPDRKSVILAEVNCETDFVAKNELFLQFVDKLLNRGLETKENIENCDDKN